MAYSSLETLKRRSEFLHVSRKGASVAAKALVVQAVSPHHQPQDGKLRVGFTVSGKVGCAVIRNRVKRRLKAAARETCPVLCKPELHYVIIGRHAAFARPYASLIKDLRYAIHSVHEQLAMERPVTG